MNVVICSAFRNSESYIDRYFEQMYELERLLFLRGDCLSLVLGYGDCSDDTATLLFEHTSGGIGARLIDCPRAALQATCIHRQSGHTRTS